MPTRCHYLTVLLLAVVLGACASGDLQGQASTNDGGVDADADQPDAGQSDAKPDTGPTFSAPEFYHSTSGGGLSTSSEHRMQMNFGAPMPRGTSSNDEYRIHFGPVSP